jgi:hypothetical protein
MLMILLPFGVVQLWASWARSWLVVVMVVPVIRCYSVAWLLKDGAVNTMRCRARAPTCFATAPLKGEASNPAVDGSVVPRVSSHGVAPWCDDGKIIARATRFIECENRVVPFYLRVDGVVKATALFDFQRTIELTGTNTFTEHLSIAAQDIPTDFALIQLAINKHLCGSPCTPVEASASAWKGSTTWTAGDTHEASITSSYIWDTSTSGKTYFFYPDVQIDGDEYPSDGSPQYQTTGYQWSLSTSRATDLGPLRHRRRHHRRLGLPQLRSHLHLQRGQVPAGRRARLVDPDLHTQEPRIQGGRDAAVLPGRHHQVRPEPGPHVPDRMGGRQRRHQRSGRAHRCAAQLRRVPLRCQLQQRRHERR